MLEVFALLLSWAVLPLLKCAKATLPGLALPGHPPICRWQQAASQASPFVQRIKCEPWIVHPSTTAWCARASHSRLLV